jgi:hypothetical protein
MNPVSEVKPRPPCVVAPRPRTSGSLSSTEWRRGPGRGGASRPNRSAPLPNPLLTRASRGEGMRVWCQVGRGVLTAPCWKRSVIIEIVHVSPRRVLPHGHRTATPYLKPSELVAFHPVSMLGHPKRVEKHPKRMLNHGIWMASHPNRVPRHQKGVACHPIWMASLANCMERHWFRVPSHAWGRASFQT